MRPGDIVVTGTDGLLDNVFPVEAAAIVSSLASKGNDPMMVAAGLAEFARLRSLDQSLASPFALGARAKGFQFNGGKEDDITVVVSFVAGASRL